MQDQIKDLTINERIKLGMTLAIREEIERKKKLGEKYAVERNGKILIIDPVTGTETEVKKKESEE